MPSSQRVDNGLVEIYKVAVDAADKISARRMTANGFFITLNTAIIAANRNLDSRSLALLGLLFCVAWFVMLRSYKHLNAAKFKVINHIEKSLPAAPFADEWKIVKGDKNLLGSPKYAELSTVEIALPIALGLFYVYILLARFGVLGIIWKVL